MYLYSQLRTVGKRHRKTGKGHDEAKAKAKGEMFIIPLKLVFIQWFFFLVIFLFPPSTSTRDDGVDPNVGPAESFWLTV